MRIPAGCGPRLPTIRLTFRARDVRVPGTGVGPTALLLAVLVSLTSGLLALTAEAKVPGGAVMASVQRAGHRLEQELHRMKRERLTLAEVRRVARQKQQELAGQQEEWGRRAAAVLQVRK